QGNVAFKAGDYPTAIGHYTSAIIADRTEPTYYLNRAAAYLKLGKAEDAERDCTSSLDLSKSNIKALFRRAQARIALGKHLEARKGKTPIKSESTRYATPATLFDFQKTWDTISSPNHRWIFLNTVPPGDLPTLCQTSLEPSLLASILSTFLENLRARPEGVNMKERMLEYLESFGKVQRFSTIVLFLSAKEKEVAREVWEQLGSSMDRPWGLTI
ncbi:hypothetical protein CPB83DRAFT_774755, partial [Crepidotus variabilis]